MNNTGYFILLQQVFGFGSTAVKRIIDLYGSPRRFFELGEQEWRLSGVVTPGKMHVLQKADIKKAEQIIKECRRLGYKILTPDSPEYPNRLRNLEDYPAVLYVDGELPDMDNEVCIAVVGTRQVSNYGQKVTHTIAGQLTRGGAITVSGAAVGVDSIAHRASLQQGGKTVAVLGCGINAPYLMENSQLRNIIAKNGAVISEYPPMMLASRYTFPTRNRIISGLCLGTVVIEAGAKSGSLITANHALAQGRDVFAVPGSAISPLYEGTNRMLRDGAKPVFSGLDVLEEYAAEFPHKINIKQIMKDSQNSYAPVKTYQTKVAEKPPSHPMPAEDVQVMSEEKPPLPKDSGSDAKQIYSCLTAAPMQVEEIAAKSNLPIIRVMTALTELELLGIIQSGAGKTYFLTPAR